MTTKQNDQAMELAALTSEQTTLYYEAIDCGASHDDAMEAAATDGYTHQ